MSSAEEKIVDGLNRFADAIEIEGTPSNERLIEWAAASPPPQHWLDGVEEDLF